jgi:hypothetical protein
MKKIYCILIAALLCLTVLVPVSAATSAEEHAKTYEIAYGTPVLDMKLDDCYKKSTLVTFNTAMGDANGEVYYCWDETALYFHVTINDKTPCTNSEKGVTANTYNTDSLEMITALYKFDPKAEKLPAKVLEDIGDAQFRIYRTKANYPCEDLVTNDLSPATVGGFYASTFTNDGSKVVHNGGTDDGYMFEGYVKWSDELQKSDAPLGEGSIIGLGLQINDDTNDDGKRDKKIYNLNANEKGSMSSDRATCGAFKLVKAAAVTTAAPVTTVAPATTKAPVTTAVPAVTTAAPAQTPATADTTVVFVCVCAMALILVVSRKRVR